METKENKKKKISSGAIIFLSILIVVAIISGLAYAKYRTSLNGTDIAQVAKWSFNYKIVDATQTEDVENFAITRTDRNTQVAESTIAPGTSGEFVIEIDASRNRNVFNLQCNTRFHRQTN